MPYALAHVWGWFLELSATRGANGFGFASITFNEIAQWARVTGRDPLPFEVALIRRLDLALRDSLHG